MPDEFKYQVTNQLYAAIPDLDMTQIADQVPAQNQKLLRAHLSLRRDIFPIRRHADFLEPGSGSIADPVAILLSALPNSKAARIRASVELAIRPCSQRRVRHARRIIARLNADFFHKHPNCRQWYAAAATSSNILGRLCAFLFWRFSSARRSVGTDQDRMQPITHAGESTIEAAKDKCGRHLFETTLTITVTAPADASELAKASLANIVGAFSAFGSPRLASFKRLRWLQSRGSGFLMSSEELATLWHPPVSGTIVSRSEHVQCRTLEPPSELPRVEHNATAIGRTLFRGSNQTFGLLRDDRMRHVFLCGKTGMGKSSLLRSMALSDITSGRGLGLIDPHGDLADSLVSLIPSHRTNDTIVCDTGDLNFPVAFNPLACHWPDQRPLVASGVLSAFKKLFGDSWGPRMENILRNALLALLETPGTSLVHLVRLLQDDNYRRSVVGRLTDPAVRAFWLDEFAKWNDRYRTEAIAPVLNKLGFFVSNPILRNILGQSESRVNLRSIMDSQKILIVNLSKGRIGDDASSLLGALFVSSLQLAAMSRADIPEEERKDFFLYVDEFQNFATDSFATILSEARKYRLSLTIANQYLGQMDESIANAVFGNVGSIISFQLGAGDSEVMSEQFGGVATPDDFMGLPKYTAYARLLIDGMTQRPFSMKTIPPRKHRQDRSEIVRKVSRSRYARPRDQVEADIAKTFAFRDHRSSKNSASQRHGREIAG